MCTKMEMSPRDEHEIVVSLEIDEAAQSIFGGWAPGEPVKRQNGLARTGSTELLRERRKASGVSARVVLDD